MNRKFMPSKYFIFLLLLSIFTYFLFPIARVIPFPYNLTGILFIIFGIVLNLWADGMFKKDNTTVKPYLKSTTLEVSGPFRISRHPMYLGMFSILLGSAIFLGVITAFILSFLYIVIMEVIFIPEEERNLAEAFGEEYSEYKKRVRRWI